MQSEFGHKSLKNFLTETFRRHKEAEAERLFFQVTSAIESNTTLTYIAPSFSQNS